MEKDILSVFNKYAGKEVAVVETPYLDFQENDATITAIEKDARENGLSVRVWLPGSFGTMDMNPHRLNVHVEKEADGQYRVQPKFNLG